jgi:sulfur carrier protein
MKIIINNQSYALDESSSLQLAIDMLKLQDTSGIAVALNEQIILRSKWAETQLQEEDKIIIIGAVAGG